MVWTQTAVHVHIFSASQKDQCNEEGSAYFFMKDKIVNILGFLRRMVSVTASHRICHFSVKADLDRTETNKTPYVPTKP